MRGRGGAGGKYYSSSLLTASASAITWQTTETPSPSYAESKMSRPPATRAAAAACTQELNKRRGALDAAAAMRSNAPQNQPPFPAARVKHTAHTAQHARRCSRTCTFFTRPRITRSITTSDQLHDMRAMCISAGAVASRWHANATQRSMRRTRPHGEHSAKTQPRGGSAGCRR